MFPIYNNIGKNIGIVSANKKHSWQPLWLYSCGYSVESAIHLNLEKN